MKHCTIVLNQIKPVIVNDDNETIYEAFSLTRAMRWCENQGYEYSLYF